MESPGNWDCNRNFFIDFNDRCFNKILQIGETLRFKNKRIQNEWESGKLDKRLMIIVSYLDWFCKEYVTRVDGTKQDIQITCLFRTQSEQDAVYKNNVKYQKKKWMSVHQIKRGADIGVNAFSTEMKKALQAMLNKRFYGGSHSTCVWHNMGLGDHFHVQVSSDTFTKILQ